MIKAGGSFGGNTAPMLLLGLEGENITRLLAGEPIIVDAHDPQLRQPGLEMPVLTVVIVAGKDHDEIKARITGELDKKAAQLGG